MAPRATRQNGELIRRLRKELGLNLITFGVEAGLAANTLSNIESGAQSASEVALHRIARALGVAYEDILSESAMADGSTRS